MRLILAGIGRLKPGPERMLFERYQTRAQALCRAAGIVSLDVVEVDEGRARAPDPRKREEAAALAARLPAATLVLALDETGRALTSQDFARLIGGARDRGQPALAIAVGGPDGFDADFLRSAGERMAFGAATLPHQMVRVLAAEQVYRAFTILTGHPYHRN